MVTSTRLRHGNSWLTGPAISEACSGRLLRRGGGAGRVHTDSRDLQPGDCFVALVGDRFDAHEFLPEVLAKGVAGVVLSRRLPHLVYPEGCFVVLVEDTQHALVAIAAAHRQRHSSMVIGITGSCGKTSTKDMLARILETKLKAVASPNSFNNHVGVPLSLLQIRADTEVAVIEIGSNAPGEVGALARIARPDIGIITCVGESHLSGFGDVDGVAAEKASLLAQLNLGGVAILNVDDVACRKIAERHQGRQVLVRVDREADWFATDVCFHGLGTSFLLQGERPVTLQRLGSHNVYNALLSIAAAVECGLELDSILAALCNQMPSHRRMESRRVGEVTLFDDTYNMNPTSARAAILALAGLPGKGRRLAVFGEMHELGRQSGQLHRRLGREVAQAEFDYLVTVGGEAAAIAEGALAGGMKASQVQSVEDTSHALHLLICELRPEDRLLCKASRRVGLDRLVDDLARLLAPREA